MSRDTFAEPPQRRPRAEEARAVTSDARILEEDTGTAREGAFQLARTAEGEQVAAAGEELERLILDGGTVAGDVLLVDQQTGQRVRVSPDEARAALRGGEGRFRAAGATARQDQRLEDLYGGAEGEAFAESALRTLMLGGPRVSGLAAQRARELAERNREADLAGRIVGGAAQGLAVGAGAAAMGARGIVGGLAEGAVEGALQGVTDLGRETALDGDAELNAERILGTVGLNTVLGMGVGGLFGAGEDLASAALRANRSRPATREAVSRLIERTTGQEARPGVADLVLERLGRVGSAGLGADDAAFVRRALSTTEEGRQLRQVLEQGDSIVGETTATLRRQLDDMAQIQETASDFASGSLKRGQVRRSVRSDTLDVASGEATALAGEVRRFADSLEADSALVGGAMRARRLRGQADELERELAAALSQDSAQDAAADVFIALDRAKRRLGRESASAFRSRSGLQDYAEQYDGLYERFRRHLEDQAVYGDAAATQREINAAWSPSIASGRDFDRAFRTSAGEQDGFRRLMTADSAKLNTWLQQTGTARSATRDELFEKHIANMDAFHSAVARHYDLPDETRAVLESSRRNVAELRETLGRVRTTVQAKNQFDDIARQLGDREGALGGLLGSGAVAGGIVGGAPGAALGALASAAARPDRAIRMMAALERMGATFDRRLGGSVRRFVDQLSGASVRVGDAARGGRAARSAAQGATIAAASDRFDEAIERMSDMTPDALHERLSMSTRRFADQAPGLTARMTETAARALAYMEAQIPPGAMLPPYPGAPQYRPSESVSRDEMMSFLRALDVVEDPLSVLDEAASGTLTMDHTHALQAVWPSLHTAMVTQVVEEVADREDPLPYEGRVRLSLLLGAPTDPSMEGAYIRRAQMAYATTPPTDVEGVVSPSNASPPEVSDSIYSAQQRLAQEGPA